MSKTYTTLSREGYTYLIGLIRNLANVSEGIDDLHLRSDGTFSSVKIDTLLNTLRSDCNEYTDRLVANLSRLELKIANDESEISQPNIMYLYKAVGETSYSQYVVIEGTKILLGTCDIDMGDYYTITQADAKFVLKTDFDSLKTEVDKKLNKTDVDNITIINADGVNIKDFILEKCIDGSKVYHITSKSNCTNTPKEGIYYYMTVQKIGTSAIKVTAKGGGISNNEYVCTYRSDSAKWSDWEKVLLSSDIVTTIDSSSTNDKAAGAKAMYDELNKKLDVEEANIVNLIPFPYDSSIISENSGITFKVDDEGAIHVSGTKTTDNLVQYYPIRDTIGTSGYLIDTFEVGKTYTLSGCPSGGSTKTYRLRILFNYDKSSEGLTPYQYIDMGAGVTFTIESEIKYIRIMIDYSGTTSTTYGDLIFKPQITEGAKVIDFKTSLNRNNLSQLNNTVTSTINGLNGRIPINSGEDMDNITTVGFYSVLSGAIALTVSNLPIKSACFVDVYGNNHTVGKGWLVQEIKASNSADAPIYRRSRIHEGNWGQWQRLCVTSVKDVPKTSINLPDISSEFSSGKIDFEVLNGVCYMTVFDLIFTNTSTGNLVVNIPGIPKRKNDGWHTISNIISSKTLVLNIGVNGDSIEFYTAREKNEAHYGSFSYPVAES